MYSKKLSKPNFKCLKAYAGAFITNEQIHIAIQSNAKALRDKWIDTYNYPQAMQVLYEMNECIHKM